jgi:hypothetical protein
MHRSLLIAGTFALATFAVFAAGNREASAARLIYGTCFPHFRSCMAGCSGLERRYAFDNCLARCYRAPRCESDRYRREASNRYFAVDKLPAGQLPESQLPASQMPDDRLPEGRLP